MSFIKILKAEEQTEHSIPVSLLNSLANDMKRAVKFANDMNDAGAKLSAKNKDKIEEAARIIFNKIEEIRHNII